jgi:hypothetical protein
VDEIREVWKTIRKHTAQDRAHVLSHARTHSRTHAHTKAHVWLLAFHTCDCTCDRTGVNNYDNHERSEQRTSTSRVQRDHSSCTALRGVTAWAAHMSSGDASLMPTWRTLPSACRACRGRQGMAVYH